MRSPSNSNNGENSSNISADNTVPQKAMSVNNNMPKSAFNMPENDAQGDFDGQAETDAAETPKTQAERNMQAMIGATTGRANGQNSVSQAAGNNSLPNDANGGIISNNDMIENGGVENGSQNTELLAGGEVSAAGGSGNGIRAPGVNTEIIRGELGKLHGDQGNNANALAAGETGWLSETDLGPAVKVGGGLKESFLRNLRRIKLNGYDSIGRKLSLENTEKLADTVFRYEDGTVFSLFHWTPNKFDEFKYGDGVFHLGTLSAALAAPDISGNIVDVYEESIKFIENFTQMGYTEEEIKKLLGGAQSDESGSNANIENGNRRVENEASRRQKGLYFRLARGGNDTVIRRGEVASRKTGNEFQADISERTNTRGMVGRISSDSFSDEEILSDEADLKQPAFFMPEDTKDSITVNMEAETESGASNDFAESVCRKVLGVKLSGNDTVGRKISIKILFE